MIQVHWSWFVLYYLGGVAFILGTRYFIPEHRVPLSKDDIVFAIVAAPALGLFLLCWLVDSVVNWRD